MEFYDFMSKFKNRRDYTCKFCNASLPNIDNVVRHHGNSFEYEDIIKSYSLLDYLKKLKDTPPDWVVMEYVKCPKCGKTSIELYRPATDECISVYPRHSGKVLPDYIPEQIRQDYDEACLIADLSPKASATLSRRCVQGMIRDFWGITKTRLLDEINEVAKQPTVSELQKNALHALRDIGNIGAHPERDINLIVDVETNEAKKMISLIEFFVNNWYIQKHKEEEMMNEIIDIAKQKDCIKKNSNQLGQN